MPLWHTGLMPTAPGLSSGQAQARLARDGPNELPTPGRRGAWRLLGEVLREPMFLLLVACGALYLLLGDVHEALTLLVFVVVVMAITAVQKHRSERSLEALRDLSSPRALVWRDGQPQRIAGRDLVAGDVVLLAEGDRVPADLRLLATAGLCIDESMLSGESVPVAKHPFAGAPGDAPPADSLAFSGTLVTQGSGQGVVVATGVRSSLGRIGASLRAIDSGPTPVQAETQRIVAWVAVAGLALALALALAWGLSRGEWLMGLLAGLTLAMAILPEELPVVLTIFMGLGAWRLARQQVLTRRMPAVETLGATTVLCVDKTGTLTQNRMALRRLWVDGDTQPLPAPQQALPEAFHPVLEYALLASHRRTFDPMETAIVEAGQTLLADTEHLHADWQLVDDYPLSRDMLAMSRVWQSPDHRHLLVAAKGAPEAVVDLCHLDGVRQAAIAQAVEALARDGLRVLGVARAVFPAGALPPIQHGFDFEWVGLLAMEDPLRPEVPRAIAECHAAGIRVVMVTGDHAETALAMGRQAGLRVDTGFLTGADIDALDDADLARHLRQTDLYCRVQPQHKLRLVQTLRAMGEVVAMTGDGVNDAPALKAAHIGVAMGARGTDVAREAADLVLLQDDFASLVQAVRHGRRVFANLRKAIAFVLAVHLPIIGLALAPLLLGWPLVLMPVHILFLQLVIDPACSIVLEAEPLERGAMQAPPRSPQARLFDRHVWGRGLAQGVGLLAIVVLAYAQARAASGADEVARALAFVVLVVANLALIHVNRHWRRPARAHRAWNPAFVWMVLATAAVLLLVFLVPGLLAWLGFARPGAALWLAAAGWCLAAWAWFEAVRAVGQVCSPKG